MTLTPSSPVPVARGRGSRCRGRDAWRGRPRPDRPDLEHEHEGECVGPALRRGPDLRRDVALATASTALGVVPLTIDRVFALVLVDAESAKGLVGHVGGDAAEDVDGDRRPPSGRAPADCRRRTPQKVTSGLALHRTRSGPSTDCHGIPRLNDDNASAPWLSVLGPNHRKRRGHDGETRPCAPSERTFGPGCLVRASRRQWGGGRVEPGATPRQQGWSQGGEAGAWRLVSGATAA